MDIKSLRGLRLLIKLYENGCNFGIHKQLGVPRSTLWAHINDLEKETGLTFFVRKKQNNTFTEEAQRFLPYAKSLVELFEKGIAEASNAHAKEPAGEIIVATTPAVASSWLMESIAMFQVIYPKISLKVIAGDYISTTTERLADILLRPINEKDFLLRHWSVPYHLALWASEGYVAKNGLPKQSTDLRDHTMLAYGEYTFSYFPEVDWHLKGRWGDLPRLNARLTINSTQSLYLAAQQGIGICSASVQSNIFYKGDKLMRVLPHIDGPVVRVYFCTKKEVSLLARQNTHIFNTFFLRYLEDLGVYVDQEKEEHPSHYGMRT